VRLTWPGPIGELHTLRTATSVARLWSFDVPRPRGLLGDAHLRTLRAGLAELVAAAPAPFTALRMSAAGRDSEVLQRLAEALAEAVGLAVDHDDGDLLVRLRRGQAGPWELLVRTTPRPMSVRTWRVCDRPGGLDAAVAAAAVRLARPRAAERVFGAMVGSGTLLIERALTAPAERLDGVDVDEAAVACARANAVAAGTGGDVHVWRADVRALEIPDGAFDLILLDPPWGDAVGAHRDNEALYAATLQELARVAAPGARLVLVTHEVRLSERLLDAHPYWRVLDARRIWHGGHRPLLAILRRQGGRLRAAT
jgi:tRNA (guanine6-N2)-methyltransferase